MSDPEPSDEKSIIRVLRYLKQSGMVEYLYKWQDSPTEILVYTDSDWAGCQRTRRSTTRGAVMYGSCLVAHWSRIQVSVALSSAEAELNAAVKAACEAFGMKQLCGHLGMPVTIKMCSDSPAMKGTLSRKGSGKVKHLETRQLWLQEHIASGNVVLLKVQRDLNPADDLTHFWCKADGIKHFSKMSLAEGRYENSRQERIKNEPAVCASLMGSAYPVAMTRIRWADQTGQGERGFEARVQSLGCRQVLSSASVPLLFVILSDSPDLVFAHTLREHC